MSFCPKCGRQLSDGEVCNCQAQNTQQVQPDADIAYGKRTYRFIIGNI